MKNILIPTDFSDNAWLATAYALQFFKDTECTFYFLHSTKISVSRISTLSNKLLDVMRKNAVDDLEKLEEKVKTTYPNQKHTYKTLISNLSIDQAIEVVSQNNNVELVIMGTKGVTGATETIFGSNTVNVVNSLKTTPVFIIPNIYEYKAPQRIGFPSDFKRAYKRELIKPIKDFAKTSNATVKIMHINTEKKLSTEQEQNLDALTMYLDMDGIENDYNAIADYADKTTEMLDFIVHNKVDILTMISYKHNFFEKLLREPVINNLGHHINIPFLVIPEK